MDSGGWESICSLQATGAAQPDADSTPPSGALTINGGAATAPWTAATLELSATDNIGVTGYYIATNATPPAATAPACVTVAATPSYSNSNVPYTLSGGDGPKTVYAWYKDAAGSVSSTGVDPSGSNGSGAIGAVGSGSAATGAPTATLTATRSGSLILGVGNDPDNAVARIPGVNQVLAHQHPTLTGRTFWVQALAVATSAGQRITINDTVPKGDRYNLSVIEILPQLGP